MDAEIAAVFAAVYFGMILGRIPGLALDRTGMALLGAIILIVTEKLGPADACQAVDTATIGLLFALMVVSSQFRLSGFYSFSIRRVSRWNLTPTRLLAATIFLAGLLSALLANDIVCLAMSPLLVEGCARRNLDPKPFLLALACAANVGSAATLIGNPQNMLIGQVLGLSFPRYIAAAGLPAMVGLWVIWAVIHFIYRGRWLRTIALPSIHAPEFNRWQTGKGLAILVAVIALFLGSGWPRELVALAAAGLLLCSRKMRSREMLALVDWQLIILFCGLFILNHAMVASGNSERLLSRLVQSGIDLNRPATLFTATVLLSNLVSNVPAVMLLLPSAGPAGLGALLALASTLAGNLILIGSIANLIVVDQAGRLGISISWRDHAAIGIPVTLGTLAVAAAWLWWIGGM